MSLESDARVIANALGFGGFGKNFHVSTLTLMDAKNTKKNHGNSGQSADAEDICGAGAKVYRVKFTMGNHSEEKVVKLVNKRKYFNNEKAALEQLSKGAVSGDDGSGPSRYYYKATQFFSAEQFFLMPFARISLFHFLRDCHHDALPIGLYVFWMSQILDALTFAHSVGVMHGDVKLENIFLSLGGAILGDWGFAVCRITDPVRMLEVVRTLPETLSVISIRDSNSTPTHESVKALERAVERAVVGKQGHSENAIIDTLNAKVPLYKVHPCGTLGMLHMLQVSAIYQQHFVENYPPLLVTWGKHLQFDYWAYVVMMLEFYNRSCFDNKTDTMTEVMNDLSKAFQALDAWYNASKNLFIHRFHRLNRLFNCATQSLVQSLSLNDQEDNVEEEIARGLMKMLNHASSWESQSEAVETAKVVLEQSSRYSPGYTVTIFDTPRVNSPSPSSPISSHRPPACHGCQVS